MGIKLGGGSGKSSQTGTRDATGTLTPTAPDWLTQMLQSNTAKATDLAGADPQTYVAGQNGLQLQANDAASKLSGSPWNFDNAVGAINSQMAAKTPQIASASLLDNLKAYQDPYKDQVVNAATADFDANAGKTRAQQTLDIANQGAFGGSGAALTKSATEGELSRARNSTVSGLLDQMFNTSAGLSNEDANRRQAADTTNAGLKLQNRQQVADFATKLGDLSTQYDTNQRANAGTMATLGGQAQDTQQKQAQAPLDLMSWLNSQGVNNDLLAKLFGQTSTESEKTTGTGKTSGFQWGASGSYGGANGKGNYGA